MSLLNILTNAVSDCIGVADNGDGTYRLDFANSPSRLATDEEIILATNRQTWAAQAQARKDRDARKALALPDSDDPKILKQKLNAALALLNVR